jgi:hypothetical protein
MLPSQRLPVHLLVVKGKFVATIAIYANPAISQAAANISADQPSFSDAQTQVLNRASGTEYLPGTM